MSSKIGWFEVMGEDDAALVRFYGEILGWKTRGMEGFEGYHFVETAEGDVPGGIGKAERGKGWTTFYVDVDDVDATVERASALGGSVVMPAMTLPGGTRLAVIADPEGHPVGIAQKA